MCVPVIHPYGFLLLTVAPMSSNPHTAASSISMLSYDTPFPPMDVDSATHTYETPLDRRPRPAVTVSFGAASDIDDGVIVNHTRTGSHAEASVYEEPLVSVPQYDSILQVYNIVYSHYKVYLVLMSERDQRSVLKN